MQAIPARTDNQLDALTRINLQDMLDNLGLGHLRRGRGLIEQIFWGPAQSFARTVIAFDRRIDTAGLQTASAEMLARYTCGLDVAGAEHVPADGPVLFVANHPGMADSLACFAAITRNDLRVVANDRPFTRLMPALGRHLIYVSDQPGERLSVARNVTRHLNDGGAVFINPAGHIEPDPSCMPGAVESLATWSDSLALFVRRVATVRVVPIIVSGVILPATLRHPLTRIRRNAKDRERVAATLQLLLHTLRPTYRPLRVRVALGRALSASELIASAQGETQTSAIMQRITTEARRLIEHVTQSSTLDAANLPVALRE